MEQDKSDKKKRLTDDDDDDDDDDEIVSDEDRNKMRATSFFANIPNDILNTILKFTSPEVIALLERTTKKFRFDEIWKLLYNERFGDGPYWLNDIVQRLGGISQAHDVDFYKKLYFWSHNSINNIFLAKGDRLGIKIKGIDEKGNELQSYYVWFNYKSQKRNYVVQKVINNFNIHTTPIETEIVFPLTLKYVKISFIIWVSSTELVDTFLKIAFPIAIPVNSDVINFDDTFIHNQLEIITRVILKDKTERRIHDLSVEEVESVRFIKLKLTKILDFGDMIWYFYKSISNDRLDIPFIRDTYPSIIHMEASNVAFLGYIQLKELFRSNKLKEYYESDFVTNIWIKALDFKDQYNLPYPMIFPFSFFQLFNYILHVKDKQNLKYTLENDVLFLINLYGSSEDDTGRTILNLIVSNFLTFILTPIFKFGSIPAIKSINSIECEVCNEKALFTKISNLSLHETQNKLNTKLYYYYYLDNKGYIKDNFYDLKDEPLFFCSVKCYQHYIKFQSK